MKLAICSVGELFGGVERHILGMSTWLKREGHEFILILFHDRELARQARKIGVEPVILETRGSFDRGAPRRLARILGEHRVDVVHAHGYRSVVNCALARRTYRFKMVRTVHGLVESSGWWSPRGFKGNFYTWLERYFGRRERAGAVYVTRNLRHLHTKHDRGLVTRTIYNGIDPLNREAYPRPVDLESGVFHLGAVGRVTRIKGLENAIRAVSELDPELRVVLNIIGTGPLAGDLKAMAQELGACDKVRFLGFKENVYDYLAHIDALIMPSLHEGLPYTILEAMSLGTPIIASSVGGLSEVLEHRKTALLVKVGDKDAIRDSIHLLLRDEKIGREIMDAARRFQAESLTLDSMGADYWRSFDPSLPGSMVQ